MSIYTLTCPQADAIEPVGEQVVPHPVGAPVEAAPGVGYEPLRVSPAEAYVGRQMGATFDVVHYDLVVPALVHGRADTVGHVDVGVHTESRHPTLIDRHVILYRG